MGRSAAISTVGHSNFAAVAYLGSGCDIGFHQHDRLLEFIAGPQCPVIQVAARLTFFDKFCFKKKPLVGLKPMMLVPLPANLPGPKVSNETRLAFFCRNN